jgi:hypothetical protein
MKAAPVAKVTPATVGVVDFRRSPPIQLFGQFRTRQSIESAISTHDYGDFTWSAALARQMLANPRLRGVVETRLNGLMGTAIRWEPARSNDIGRRAAKAIAEDWPLIASEAARKQLHQWGLILGVGFAQKHWHVSPTSGRAIPRLEVFDPAWTSWDWGPRLYRISSQQGVQWVRSPAQTVPGEDHELPAGSKISIASPMQWVVHEPFGQHSWLEALIHPTGETYLAHQWARRDMARAAEKLGLAAIKVLYPEGAGNQKALSALLLALRRLHSEGILPLEQRLDGSPGMNVEPFEYGGQGYDIIQRTKDSNSVDFSVLYLGHNLTTEVKGGSYAAANVGDLIRGDIKAFDGTSEASTMRFQVVADWAEMNFGDRELAPLAVYETDPPALNMTAAQTLTFVAQAIATLGKVAPWIDFEALLARFRVPMLPGIDRKIVQPPPPTPPGGGPVPPAGGDGKNLDAAVKRLAADLDSVARVDRPAAQAVVEGWLAGLVVKEPNGNSAATV